LFLGGGSNILLTQDFDGLAIKLNLKGISEENLNENETLVTAKAGENWHEFVILPQKNYGGLENLSLIPGNVGTSPMQNIGAYGTEIKDVFVTAKFWIWKTLSLKLSILNNADLGTEILFSNRKEKEICYSGSYFQTDFTKPSHQN
jgi:UDP-N-acetylmuramate dehydrogenase